MADEKQDFGGGYWDNDLMLRNERVVDIFKPDFGVYTPLWSSLFVTLDTSSKLHASQQAQSGETEVARRP